MTITNNALDDQIPRGLKHAAIISVAVFLTYFNSLQNSFLYDDEQYILINAFIRDFAYLPNIFLNPVGAGVYNIDNLYRPLQLALYSVVFHFYELNVIPYHLLNIALHICCSLLTYQLSRRILGTKDRDASISLAAGLLFGLHPVHTEAITYINGTAEPLACAFGLASILLYLRQGAGAYIAALFLLIISFFAKETAAVFPVIMGVISIYERKSYREIFKRISPFAVLSAGYLYVRLVVFNFSQSEAPILNPFNTLNILSNNWDYRIYSFFKSFAEYLSVFFFPYELQYDRTMVVITTIAHPLVLLGLFCAVLLLYFGIRSWYRERIVFFALAWFSILIFPVSGILMTVNGMMKEHWLYMPCIAPVLALCYLLRNISKEWFPAIVSILVLLLAVRTIDRNRDWRDPITFFSGILEHNPSIARVHNNLAKEYDELGLTKKALSHYQQAVEISDVYPEVHHNMALLYIELGDLKTALSEFERALELNPDFVHTHRVLSQLHTSLGNEELAQHHKSRLDAIVKKSLK